MRIQESIENYLEMVLILQDKGEPVKMSDIAKNLKVSKPSVNKAMGILKEDDYITQPRYGRILLTEKGKAYAEKVYYRHRLFKRFFCEILHVSEATAEEDACHMEHCISDETMEKLDDFLQEVLQQNQGKEDI